MDYKKHVIWAYVILIGLFLFLITIIWSSSHPFVIRFEMDNNTLEAIKSINYSAIEKNQQSLNNDFTKEDEFKAYGKRISWDVLEHPS